MKLTCLRGYSGSGKSTKARQIAQSSGAVVICRDDLRMMLLGSYWTGKREDEDRVTIAERAQVVSLLDAGVSVIVDATHLNPQYLRRWAKLATRMGAEFEVVNLYADISTCRIRDFQRMRAGGRYVGEKVIEKQFKQWPVDKWPTLVNDPFVVEPAEWNPDLPEAMICDIDGTLAHMTERTPYDYTRVMEDTPDYTILQMLHDYKKATNHRCQVLIVSGRDHTCRQDTLKWLNYHSVPFDQLLMRDADKKDERGNKIPDYVVKYDIYNKHIRGVFNIDYVLDDRDQVVWMWRKLGLKCLQVQEGNF